MKKVTLYIIHQERSRTFTTNILQQLAAKRFREDSRTSTSSGEEDQVDGRTREAGSKMARSLVNTERIDRRVAFGNDLPVHSNLNWTV